MFEPPTESDLLPLLKVLPEPYVGHVDGPVKRWNFDGTHFWAVHCRWTEGFGGRQVGVCDFELHIEDPELMYIKYTLIEFLEELRDTGQILPKMMELFEPYMTEIGMRYAIIPETRPAAYNYFLSMGFEETDLFPAPPEWAALGYKTLLLDLSPSEDEEPAE